MRTKRALILVSLLLLAVAAGGTVLALRWRPSAAVPEFDLAGAEPAVRGLIEQRRRRVIEQPASADAWGQLGQALLANGYDDEAMPVFEQASRLTPDEPRWPY